MIRSVILSLIVTIGCGFLVQDSAQSEPVQLTDRWVKG